jgi:hypothetical protein
MVTNRLNKPPFQMKGVAAIAEISDKMTTSRNIMITKTAGELLFQGRTD